MAANNFPESDPRHHTTQIKRRLQELIDHLRDDVGEVEDPRAEALFETSAEVLGGLKKAYEHFEKKNEEAWREG